MKQKGFPVVNGVFVQPEVFETMFKELLQRSQCLAASDRVVKVSRVSRRVGEFGFDPETSCSQDICGIPGSLRP